MNQPLTLAAFGLAMASAVVATLAQHVHAAHAVAVLLHVW